MEDGCEVVMDKNGREVTVLSTTRGDVLKMTMTVNYLMKGQFPLLNYYVLLVQVQDTTQ